MDIGVIDVRNPQILKWLMQNEELYEVKLAAKPISDASGSRRKEPQQRKLLPIDIRPLMKERKRPIPAEGDFSEESEGDDEYEELNQNDEDEYKEEIRKGSSELRRGKKMRPVYENFTMPKDIGSEKVSDGMIKRRSQPVAPMEESTFLLGNDIALFERFKRDGYLMFRGLLDPELVEGARSHILNKLSDLGLLSKEGKAVSKKGWTLETRAGNVISGKDDYAKESKNKDETISSEKWCEMSKNEYIQAIVNSISLRSTITLLAKGKSRLQKVETLPLTFDENFTWMRTKTFNEFTTFHADIYYFKTYTMMYALRGSKTYILKPDGTKELLDRVPTAEDLLMVQDKPVEEQICAVCGGGDREDMILLCDDCDQGYHSDTCLLPCQLGNSNESSKDEEWFCPTCSQAQPTLGTCWIPLGDTPTDHGVLAVLPGSQHLPRFFRPARADGQLPKSYYEKNSIVDGLTWRTETFKAGDVVIFDSRLVHCSTKNYHEDSYRLSLDFRWYIAPIGRKNYQESHHYKFIQEKTRDYSASDEQVKRFQEKKRLGRSESNGPNIIDLTSSLPSSDINSQSDSSQQVQRSGHSSTLSSSTSSEVESIAGLIETDNLSGKINEIELKVSSVSATTVDVDIDAARVECESVSDCKLADDVIGKRKLTEL